MAAFNVEAARDPVVLGFPTIAQLGGAYGPAMVPPFHPQPPYFAYRQNNLSLNFDAHFL